MRVTDLAHLLSQRTIDVCRHLLPMGKEYKDRWRCGSTGGEAGKSLQITLKGDKSGLWRDFNGKDGGDLVGLWQRVRGLSLHETCNEIRTFLNLPEEEYLEPIHPRIEQPAPEVHQPSRAWEIIQRHLRPLTYPEISALATLRHIPATAGLELASQCGQLFHAEVYDDGFRPDCWVITDGSRQNAQARRLDGRLFDSIDAKAKTITGCRASWPIGLADLQPHHAVLLVEGGPDFLAAWHLIWENDLTKTHRPVAMLGAGNQIPDDALPLFAGRDVQIFPHRDANMAGAHAAVRWRDTLTAVTTATISTLPTKDLNDLVQAEAFQE